MGGDVRDEVTEEKGGFNAENFGMKRFRLPVSAIIPLS